MLGIWAGFPGGVIWGPAGSGPVGGVGWPKSVKGDMGEDMRGG